LDDQLSVLFQDTRRLAALLGQRTRRTIVRPELRCSAVLVGIVRVDDEWCFLLTQRTDTLEHHKGQVSFPGGACEPGETHEDTALRECREEIALDSSLVTVLGTLDDIWTPSGFVITPIVGIVASIDDLTPSPDEVARILTIPVSFFADERNARKEHVVHDNRAHEVIFYDHEIVTVWGATALIIRDFLGMIATEGHGEKSEVRSQKSEADPQ
jgi:8-oxo-dGTP pyrophosphatase MutT (NUDIX family)